MSVSAQAKTPSAIDYVERWRQTVVTRREQHDAVCAAQGRTTSDYWARRAKEYHKFARESSQQGDPFLDCLGRYLRSHDTLLDVGAGTGRHSLPLARRVGRVVALDPSPAILGFLREDAAAEGLENIGVIEGGWPEAASKAPRADVVISAHVLYPIEDVVPFLRALDAQAGRLCFLHLMAQQPWFDQLGLWEALHGEPRRPQATYIDAVNVLHQLGCYANVEVAWVEQVRGFETLEDAVERFAESVAAGDDERRRSQLRDILSDRLVHGPDGRWTMPQERYPLATVWWEAGALAS